MVGVGSAAVLNLPIIRDDGYCLVDIKIGTPPTTHRLRFDTGSATTWVVDRVCGNGGCAIHSSSQRPYSPYDPDASSTDVDTGVYSEIQYLGGKTTGFTFHDNFDIEGTVWQQSFMAANSSSWTQMPADGFLGLAFSTIADGQTTTLVESLLWDGKLDKPCFGIFYNDIRNLNSNSGGILTIGDTHGSTYGKDVVATIPTQLSGGELQLWRVDVYAMTGTYQGWVSNAVAEGSDVNTDPIPVPVSQRLPLVAGSYTVFDTGGSAASVPTSMLVPLYRSINMDWESIKSGAHIPLCSEFTSDWHVEFEFANGQNVTIYGDQLAVPGFANREDACWPPFDDSGANEQFFLFGVRFLRNFYSTFDFGGDRPENYAPTVTLAPLRDEFKSDLV
ncbi:hypothetical protein Cpir12675_004722 [Ceratocystis pirilliformis]|uniref:Peptidase A1 domain-containing protein n=1 Tax=Ceratocystis pirilliformis TaxID=259994 RepID=A0ABR3YW96_9PEZI